MSAATALADQLDAASREAHALVRHRASALGLPHLQTTSIDFLDAAAAELRRHVAEGTTEPCPHLTASPSVVWAGVWDPARLFCAVCIQTYLRGLSPTEEHSCDRCRRYVQCIRPGIASCGPVLLSYGLCRRCADELGMPPDQAVL